MTADALRLVQVPYVVLSEAAGLLDCEGYGPLALTLNNLLAAAPAVQPAAGREEIGWAVGFMNKAAVMLGRGEMPAPGSQYAADWWRAHGVLLAALSQPGPASEGDGE